MQILLCWWTFYMYWDLLMVDLFLRQMRSNKCLVSFAAIMVSLTHPGMYFTLMCLVCNGCRFVDKGGQGSAILFLRVSDSLDGLLISSEAWRSVLIFSLSVCPLGKYRFSKLLLFNTISLIKCPPRLPLYCFSIHNQHFYLLHPLLT